MPIPIGFIMGMFIIEYRGSKAPTLIAPPVIIGLSAAWGVLIPPPVIIG
jgi:hypothetical protein